MKLWTKLCMCRTIGRIFRGSKFEMGSILTSLLAFCLTISLQLIYNIFVLMKKIDGQTDHDMSNKYIIC